jgi:hypothetical protein
LTLGFDEIKQKANLSEDVEKFVYVMISEKNLKAKID